MKLVYIKLSSGVFLAATMATAICFAQYPAAPAAAPGIELRDITHKRLRAPSSGDLGGTVAALDKDWLCLEARFDTRAEWVDEVKVKFFVSLGEGREVRVFAGELTHVNLARGLHYTAMFMHPNTLERFGKGRVNAVAVQIFYKDKLVDQRSDVGASSRWWERAAAVTGLLLSPNDSPWAPAASGRYDAIKAR